MLGQNLEREIDAPACSIFFHVTENVSELEGDACLLGIFLGGRIGVTEDADADQADNRGHEIAVPIEIGKRGVGVRGIS